MLEGVVDTEFYFTTIALRVPVFPFSLIQPGKLKVEGNRFFPKINKERKEKARKDYDTEMKFIWSLE